MKQRHKTSSQETLERGQDLTYTRQYWNVDKTLLIHASTGTWTRPYLYTPVLERGQDLTYTRQYWNVDKTLLIHASTGTWTRPY